MCNVCSRRYFVFFLSVDVGTLSSKTVFRIRRLNHGVILTRERALMCGLRILLLHALIEQKIGIPLRLHIQTTRKSTMCNMLVIKVGAFGRGILWHA